MDVGVDVDVVVDVETGCGCGRDVDWGTVSSTCRQAFDGRQCSAVAAERAGFLFSRQSGVYRVWTAAAVISHYHIVHTNAPHQL